MMIYLTSHGSIPGMGTFGTLKAGPHTLKTVEREWLDNASSKSCIPEGVYRLERHSSQKPWIGETWALVNPDLGVTHFKESNSKRYAILLHTANHQDQLEGCIGVGDRFGVVGERWGVWNSADSMKKLKSLLGEGTHYIDIRRTKDR